MVKRKLRLKRVFKLIAARGIVLDIRVLRRLPTTPCRLPARGPRFIFYVAIIVGAAFSVCGQNGNPSDPTKKEGNASRLAQLVEANVIATHAYQVLLAKKSGKGDPNCYGSGKLSDSELEALVEHQAKLL